MFRLGLELNYCSAIGWQTKKGLSSAGRGNRFFPSPKLSAFVCSTLNLLFTGRRASLLASKAPGRKADHWFPSCTEVKNVWSYNFTSSYALISCKRLLYLYISSVPVGKFRIIIPNKDMSTLFHIISSSLIVHPAIRLQPTETEVLKLSSSKPQVSKICQENWDNLLCSTRWTELNCVKHVLKKIWRKCFSWEVCGVSGTRP